MMAIKTPLRTNPSAAGRDMAISVSCAREFMPGVNQNTSRGLPQRRGSVAGEEHGLKKDGARLFAIQGLVGGEDFRAAGGSKPNGEQASLGSGDVILRGLELVAQRT